MSLETSTSPSPNARIRSLRSSVSGLFMSSAKDALRNAATPGACYGRGGSTRIQPLSDATHRSGSVRHLGLVAAIVLIAAVGIPLVAPQSLHDAVPTPEALPSTPARTVAVSSI